ncbi:exported protein of unknown function [Pseudomonas inefficax]|uniref:Uncharacterized protein n=1 Tax=Pseudomonas inefficax TaxID=2078786 RepID=A0AAQ1PAR9_9PSED|nr:exported protein of unknown function [Pseudomonas inefficax]
MSGCRRILPRWRQDWRLRDIAGSKHRVACFAGAPAPTGTALAFSSHFTCGSGHAREADNAVDGTGFARVRGQARSHRFALTSNVHRAASR